MDIKSDSVAKGPVASSQIAQQSFQSLHANKKVAIIALLCFLFFMSLVAGLFFARTQPNVKRNTPSGSLPAETDANTAILALSTTSQTVKVGQKSTITVSISQHAVQVTDVALTYDPTLLKVLSVKNGDVYDDVNYQDIQTPGKVLVSSSVNPSSAESLKTGVVLTLEVEALKAGAANIEFDQQKTLAAIGGHNFLGAATGLTLTIQP